MTVTRPSGNPLTTDYSVNHKGYDFAGRDRPDDVRAGLDGEIIERVDIYTTNWTATGALTTKDYGNYIKIKHTDGTYELHAHLRKGSSFEKGTKVKAGQIVARIGNTGNSTGPHLHSEYRTTSNVNTPVEFTNEVLKPQVTVDGDKFQELVSKSTKYDEFNAAGYSTIQDVIKKMDEVNREKNGLAEDLRKEIETSKGLAAEILKMKEADGNAMDQGFDAQKERDEMLKNYVKLEDTIKIQTIEISELKAKLALKNSQLTEHIGFKEAVKLVIKTLTRWGKEGE